MEQLIPIINKLQDVFTTVGSDLIDLPQIAVVGSQSSGKSSVLEAFVGRDFLPRGAGIVTRRPLVLQLVHVDDPKAKEYGIFLHKPKQQYTDFNEICNEIIAETDRVTGSGRNISAQPINLRLWSPNVLNLTVVDLPGLTKVATEGQDPKIVEQIREMVLGIIKKPNSLILAVSPANQDLANSDALHIAKQVDPKGDRTVGVITKIDLMDEGTNCREVLENMVSPLKLGYVGVVNRSQADIDKKTTVDSMRKKEREFFDNARDYSHLADRCGSGYLVHVLNRLLMEHIRNCMPSLRQKVQLMLADKERELEGYGDNPTVSSGTMNAFILDVITKYLDMYENLVRGNMEESEDDKKKNFKSRGGARISRAFLSTYGPTMNKLPGFKKFTDQEVFFMMKNHVGLTVPLFTPHKAFDTIVFRAIEQMRQPSLALVDQVTQILFDIHNQVEFMELTRFTALGDAIRSVVDESIRSCVNPTRRYVQAIIDNERSFVNTARPDFRGSQAICAGKAEDPRSRPLPEKPAVPEPVGVCSIYGSSKEMSNHQASELHDLVQIGSKYFDIIRDQVCDLVPKAIVMLLVNASTELLRPQMIATIFNGPNAQDLLHEDQAITRKRIACQQIVTALRRARDILNEVRVFKA